LDEHSNTVNKNGKKQNKFTKFLLKSWQPIPTWQSTIFLFLIVGLALIGFGIALIFINKNIVEVSQQYDTDCTDSSGNLINPCSVTITVTSNMKSPVFFYYELDNFYQNHRRYINSQSSNQLAGKVVSASTINSDCSPVITNGQMGKTANYLGVPLNSGDTAVPCGLIAKSWFNDTFAMTNSAGTPIPINPTGIAWPSDIGTKYKNSANMTAQWIDMEDEHFIVWMRTAGLPDFRKLWGKISQDLSPGKYTVAVTNLYPVKGFDGKKKIVLSTTGPFGGRNNFLSISYLAVGGVCVLIAGFFLIRWRQFARKQR